MLKQRVITAIILTIVFLSALFGLSPTYFPIFIGVVVLIGAWEWANLSSFAALWQRTIYTIFIAAVLLVLAHHLGLFETDPSLNVDLVKLILLIACGWWALALLLVQGYPS